MLVSIIFSTWSTGNEQPRQPNVRQFLHVFRGHMPPHHVVHVAVERCLVLAGSIAPDPHGARADEHPGGPDQLHGRLRRDHVSCLVHPVQAPQRDPSSTPFAPGKPLSLSLFAVN